MLIYQPITAAREVAPRDGLAGAVGLGVMIPPSDPVDPGGRWPNGYRLEGPQCTSAEVISANLCAELPEFSGTQPAAVDQPRWVTGPDSAPFGIRSGIVCSSFGSGFDIDVWHAEAARLLELCQWSQIAHELWNGDQARTESEDNLYLAHADAEIVGTALPIVKAVSLLEEAMDSCTCGDTTLIHVPRRATAYLAEKGLVSSVTGQTARMFTHNGSLVIADRGSTGIGPARQAMTGTTFWIYATSVLSARLGPVTYPQDSIGDAFLAHENKIIVRAQRQAAISWLCCHFAAQVTVP